MYAIQDICSNDANLAVLLVPGDYITINQERKKLVLLKFGVYPVNGNYFP